MLRRTFCAAGLAAAADLQPRKLVAKPGAFRALTEPACSYASTQHRKGIIRADDRVLAWLRSAHNGGAIPIRIFLSASRVVNDTYGLFFFDPDGGYVSAYRKDYGYEFYGWRGGVMVARGIDGTLWSALSGVAFDGPQKGRRLERIASMVTDWNLWLMLHPESTVYDLHDGKRYYAVDLPRDLAAEAESTIGAVDRRLPAKATVMGVEMGSQAKAYRLDKAPERACFTDVIGREAIAVFWYRPTSTAVAYNARLNSQTLSFYADNVSPETAPFKDRETGTRWTLAGRGIDGPLRGKELAWVPSVQCRWYAWAAEYPDTGVYGA